MTCKVMFDKQSDYKRYLGLVDNDAGFPSKVRVEIVEDIDDLFVQEALWAVLDVYPFRSLLVRLSSHPYCDSQKMFQV